MVTVKGPVPARDLGVTLMHEHVLVDFIGADKVSRDRYDADEVVRAALPAPACEPRIAVCETLVECTPAYLARDVALLQRLSEARRSAHRDQHGLLRRRRRQVRAGARLP